VINDISEWILCPNELAPGVSGGFL